MEFIPAGYKILLVGKGESRMSAVKKLLKDEGFCVDYVQKMEEALRKVKLEQPDLLLVDVCVPEMESLGLVGRLKLEPEYVDMPVILISVFRDVTNLERVFQTGVADVIVRPFQREEFLVRVKRQLLLVHVRRMMMKQAIVLRKLSGERRELQSLFLDDLTLSEKSMKKLRDSALTCMKLETLSSNELELVKMILELVTTLSKLFEDLLANIGSE